MTKCIRPSVEYFYECSMLRRNIGLMTILEFVQDSSFAVRCSRHENKKMSEKNREEQVGTTLSTIVASIMCSQIDDLQPIIEAGNQGKLRPALTRWLKNEGWKPDKGLLKLLAYPEWVEDRLTPNVDEYFPRQELECWNKLFTGYGYSIGQVWQVLFGGHCGVHSSNCIGLQTLKRFQSIPELVEVGFRGYSIAGWKSAVIDASGTKKIPVLPIDRDGQPGEITWENFDRVPTPVLCVLHF